MTTKPMPLALLLVLAKSAVVTMPPKSAADAMLVSTMPATIMPVLRRFGSMGGGSMGMGPGA